MVLKISSQFAIDFKSVEDISLQEKVKSVLKTIKNAKNVADISHFKKVKGSNTAYKMGIGFYYIVGVTSSEKEITLIRFLKRDVLTKVIGKK